MSKVKMLLVVFFIFALNSGVQAQCAMCRAALESGGNSAQAEAVNDGIVYLMIIPYVLVAAIGVFVYNSRKNIGKKNAE